LGRGFGGLGRRIVEREQPARLQPFEGSRYLGGAFAYILSRRGAEKLIAISEQPSPWVRLDLP